MMYFEIGVVDYTPRLITNGDLADYSDTYALGEAVPVITLFKKENRIDGYFKEGEWVYETRESIRQEHIYWIENSIEGLKPGDAIIMNTSANIMYKIRVDERGVGVEQH